MIEWIEEIKESEEIEKISLLDAIAIETKEFVLYLERKCSSCNEKIPRGEGWISYGAWKRLCDDCFRNDGHKRKF